jgi:hypothetical protein
MLAFDFNVHHKYNHIYLPTDDHNFFKNIISLFFIKRMMHHRSLFIFALATTHKTDFDLFSGVRVRKLDDGMVFGFVAALAGDLHR